MKNGEWVKIRATGMGGVDKIGYIDNDSAAPRYTVIQTHPKPHSYSTAKITTYGYCMELLDSEGIDVNQIDDLIDLALSTKDKKWFDELIKVKLSVRGVDQGIG